MSSKERVLPCALRLLGALLFAAGPALTARAQSNSCAGATVIGEGTFMGTTSGATNDGSANCGSSSTAPDVWYRITPAANCQLRLNTCGSSYDTVLSVHTGCPGTSANQLGCNDDDPINQCGLDSRLSIPATAGISYYIRIAGFAGASGAFVLNVACGPPPSDACANAIPVVSGTTFADSTGASVDGSASCDSPSPGPDVWYSYTATSDCSLRASTSSASFGTVVSIHSGCPGTSANELACASGTNAAATAPVTNGNTYLIRIAGVGGATGTFNLRISCGTGPGTDGPDIVVHTLPDLVQFGRIGDVVGCAMTSIICNAGNQPLDWVANPNPAHPFLVFNLYRMRNGQFDHIGQSWAKHAFAAAQADACSFGCSPVGGSLGPGCSDTYGAGLNASQSILGPRKEINPWTGAFTWVGSYLDTHQGGFDATEHRLEIHDADLDPAQNAGATYVAELYSLAHDDVDHTNSMAWEPASVSGAPGGTWSFNLSIASTNAGPAINAIAGATRTTIQAQPVNDGRCILAAKVTDNGNGTWHYDYALYNMDMDRQVGSFSIPVSVETTLTNIGFHAVESDTDEGYSNAAWTVTRDTDSLDWATVPFETNPLSNPLRWGTTYSFRFDADSAPATSTATLGLFKPGTPTTLTDTTDGPTITRCADGTVNAGTGPVTDVLLVNGSAGAPGTRTVTVGIGASVAVSLGSAPQGPSPGRYVVLAWQGLGVNARPFLAQGQRLGCTVNPTPLEPGQSPQPFRCVRGSGIPRAVCNGVSELSAPATAPWTLTRSQGFGSPVTITLQGVLEDANAGNPTGYAVTNAVTLQVQ